jgi:hypothetical protein
MFSGGGGGQPGQVVLYVRAAAVGDKFLIDCDVSPIPMRLTAPGGAVEESNTGHLRHVHEALDLNQAIFKIETTATAKWDFTSCDVSRLQ